jgi:flavodoxin
MKTLIVYDSFFGCTEKIAQAIGESLEKHEAFVVRISDLKPEQLAGIELLIVGSPTRAFRPTKAITKFLKNIPAQGLKGVKVAAFDTRVSVTDLNSRIFNFFVKFFGYAAEPIAAKLVKKDGNLITPPEPFYVKTSENSLKDGEPERAADWAKVILKAR